MRIPLFSILVLFAVTSSQTQGISNEDYSMTSGNTKITP